MCEKGAVKYIIAGEEKCPETGRQHMQVYFETKGTQREAFVRNLFPGSHIELARESKEVNHKYCTKDGNYMEFGAPMPGQGKRSDLDAVKVDLDAGHTLTKISQNHFRVFVQSISGIVSIQHMRRIIRGDQDQRTL